ncbi:phage minor head protein [Peribacillus frigoritolerans]|uniref:phage minor head protein n=1 Tax=Peribacillus frigoritolerans TaxID=450367 RepID=UPI0038721555
MNRIMERIKKLTQQMEKKSNKLETDVVSLYEKALNKYLSFLMKTYSNHEVDGILTFQEMNKYGRMKSFDKATIDIMKDLYKDIETDLNSHLYNVYSESFYYTGWAIESDSKAKLGYRSLKNEVVKESIENEFVYLTLNKHLEKNRNDVILKLRNVITQGLVRGSTYKTMSKSVQEIFEGDVVKANRVVRTESGRVLEKAKLNSALHAESKGIQMGKKWNSVGDERVRVKHTALHDVTILVKGDFKIGDDKAQAPKLFSRPENTINCRCFLTYEILGIDNNTQHDYLEDMQLEDWKKERLAS